MTDRLRQLFSYGTSIALHLLLVVTLAPCIPTVPGLIRVQRIAAEATDASDERRDGLDRSRVADRDRTRAEALPLAASQDPVIAPDRDPPPRTIQPSSQTDTPVESPEPEIREPDPVRDDAEPELEPLDDAVAVVHTDSPDDRPERAEAESRYDREAAAPRHAPITADREGPTTPESPDATARRVAKGREQPASTPTSTAGGASGSPARASPSGAGSAASDGVPRAEDAPDWWAPIATRIPSGPTVRTDGNDPDGEGAEGRVDPVPIEQTEVSDTQGERGAASSEGTAPDAEIQPVPPTDPVPSAEPVPQAADAVADAQVDGQAQDGEAPNLPVVARTATSLQMVVDGPEGETPEVSAIATERGAWIQSVDVAVRKRWTAQELPMHLQGIGVRGDVTVRFTIQPSGRTGDVRLVRKSGNEWLDALALSAIPAKVPRMPRTLEPSAVEHDITFRYR